jgi:tRNA(Ile)-lysidine synthetase-like protein
VDVPGFRIHREGQQLCWGAKVSEPFEPLILSWPGHFTLSNGQHLSLSLKEEGDVTVDAPAPALDVTRIRFPLKLRSLQPGDRIAISPGHTRKVARVLMDAKISRYQRHHVPLLLHDERIILIVGLRAAAGFQGRVGHSRLLVRLT